MKIPKVGQFFTLSSKKDLLGLRVSDITDVPFKHKPIFCFSEVGLESGPDAIHYYYDNGTDFVTPLTNKEAAEILKSL